MARRSRRFPGSVIGRGLGRRHRLRDQLRFNRWIARQVHRRGMAVALKDDGRQATQLSALFDFAIVEECFG
ncbi:MAG: endo alpha-1,4 polygalactosaminidase [Solirubrobacterales bacterium]